MAAAMNGMALHGGLDPVRRHVPGLHRLLPARDPPFGADAPARHLRDDARLDRARRGRARRTSRSSTWRRCAPFRNLTCSARPTASRRRSAGSWRCRPSGTPSMLALTRQAVPTLRKDGVGEPVRQGRLRAGRDGRQGARRHDPGDRLGGRRSPWRRARRLAKDGVAGRRRVDAVLGAVRAQPVAYRAGGAGHGAARRRRGGRRAGLGAVAGRERRLRRHGRTSAPRPRRPSSTSTSASRRPRLPRPRASC